jgi:PAS domain S-box-containing protein
MASAEQQRESMNIQLLVDSIPALIHTARPDGCIDYFNKRWLEYFGANLEQVAGWNWTAFVHPEDVERIVARWRTSLATGEIFECETRVRRADGKYRWMFHRKVPLRDANGNIVKWYGTSIDIEDRKHAELELRRSDALAEERLRLVVDTTPAMINSCRPDGHLDYVNKGWLDYFGLSLEAALDRADVLNMTVPSETNGDGRDSQPIIHPEDLPRLRSHWEATLISGKPDEHEARARRFDGVYRWHLFRAVPLCDETGRPLKWYVSGFDIEDRKRAEEAVRRSEAYLAEAQRLSHTGSFGWKVPGGEIFWSSETFRIFEYDRSVKPTVDSVVQRVHPEDRADVKEVLSRAFAGASGFEHVYRLLLSDGRIKHVHAIAHVLRDASGNLEFVGAVTDVSEQRQAEADIREREGELQQTLDLSSQQVAVFGPGGERLLANRVALDYVGSSLEEWRRTPGTLFSSDSFIHPDDRERVGRAYSDGTRSSGFAYELEMRVQGADGNYRWFLVRFNPLRDDKGEVKRWYVASADIDERKRAEDRLQHENVALREEIDKTSMFEEIVGSSPTLQAVLSRISKVAPSDSTVLITGETGTGKELVARAIHRRSNRRSRAFVSVNCAAIPRDLIASELFGHEKGAFTGATQQRLGRFELANGGTIFLDEVGDLPAETQVALLRVLQEHEFERIGGTRRIHADVRVIAATNRDLQDAIGARSFRRDLFYRLNVFPIEIPALRERKEDIRLLVEYFIDRYARKAGKRITTIDKETLRLLESYPWPGNIRELQNVIERSVIVCETENFSVDESWLSQKPPERKAESQLYLEKVAAQERGMIEAALRECQGRVSGPLGAAAKLGIARSTLESKVRSLKINKNRFRPSRKTEDCHR